jgi:hypothetical protein
VPGSAAAGPWLLAPPSSRSDQKAVVTVLAVPVLAAGVVVARFVPVRTFSRPADIGSLNNPSAEGAKQIAKALTTRCCPARDEKEM